METPAVKSDEKVRCIALIDGFNLYHAIHDCPHFHGYKWLNVRKLCERLLESPSKEYLRDVIFFTALPPWDEHKKARHLQLLSIYDDLQVRVVSGKFLPTTANCRLCKKDYDTYQEKMTDINITIEMLKIGQEDSADRIYLVTGDNDQTASVSRFRNLYPKKEVIAVVPPHRRAKSLTDMATKKMTISEAILKDSVLADPYVCRDNRSYPKPARWVNGPHPGPNWRPREQGTQRNH